MKKNLLFFIVCLALFSCGSKSTPAPEEPAPQQVTGTLNYINPAVDGPGLYFLTDSGEFLYLYNDSADLFNSGEMFKDSLGLHLQLTYKDEGRRGCPFCMVPGAQPQRLVKLISMVKE